MKLEVLQLPLWESWDWSGWQVSETHGGLNCEESNKIVSNVCWENWGFWVVLVGDWGWRVPLAYSSPLKRVFQWIHTLFLLFTCKSWCLAASRQVAANTCKIWFDTMINAFLLVINFGLTITLALSRVIWFSSITGNRFDLCPTFRKMLGLVLVGAKSFGDLFMCPTRANVTCPRDGWCANGGG